MSLRVETIRPGFVAEIDGIDISRPVAAEAMAVLWEAIDSHAVLVFRGQTLTDAEQIAFTQNFGQPERYVFSYSKEAKLRLERPEMVDISNLDAATGKPQEGAARALSR
jgi:alpha-ketoglutarate-dependent 2,4-dichlorophenoxyacetate dioxygenase